MAEHPADIPANFPLEARFLQGLLVATLILLGVGVASPIITLNKFLILENTFSVVGGVIELLKEGKLFLFFAITVFSIVLPLLKIGVLFRILLGTGSNERLGQYLHWMHLYGKWSMLDVFVVAVLVVTVKLGAIANVEVHYGLYAFAAAVVLTMYVTARVVALGQCRSQSAPVES